LGNDKFLVQNIDIFTPIVDDPYTQGKIAACNLTNDVFAVGALDLLGVLCFLATPMDVPKTALNQILNGFQDFLKEIDTSIIGGHTIINPWILIGGSVSAKITGKHIVRNSGAKSGDVLVLTKPLGTQPAMALSRMLKQPKLLDGIEEIIPKNEIEEIPDKAIKLMQTSNKPVVEIIRDLSSQPISDFKVHAMTDVTGFGLAGHAENIARASNVDIEINKIPHIKWTLELSEMCGYNMKNARSAETAGGMLIALTNKNAEKLVKKLGDAGISNFIVGKVKRGSGNVLLSKNVEFVAY